MHIKCLWGDEKHSADRQVAPLSYIILIPSQSISCSLSLILHALRRNNKSFIQNRIDGARHEIAEIIPKFALSTNQSINQRIGGVMVRLLASGAVDRKLTFKARSGQTKNYKFKLRANFGIISAISWRAPSMRFCMNDFEFI
jgi:hypothetical protein